LRGNKQKITSASCLSILVKTILKNGFLTQSLPEPACAATTSSVL